MSEAIKPLDPLSLIDLFPDEATAGALAEVLEGDAVYAPADVSPTPIRPVARRVRTLTNSPDCVPAGSPGGVESPQATKDTPRTRAVRTDAWALPAPATWGRTRRAAGPAREVRSRPRRVEPGRDAGRRSAAARSVRKAPSSDWALPF